MNALVLMPRKSSLSYCLLTGKFRDEIYSGMVGDFRDRMIGATVDEILNSVKNTGEQPGFAVMRIQYGGTSFPGPVLADGTVLKKLEMLAGEAPLHIPPAVALAREFMRRKENIPLLLIFETSFFVPLPEREASYAVPGKLAEALKLRRFGCHGIYHRGAVEDATGLGASKLISICLEPRPEIAAVSNGRPLLSTSGGTPLEGLPGEKSCGEIDPFIITTMNKKLGYGPEHINNILSRESGVAGLSGCPLTLPEIFQSEHPEAVLARKLFEYRILQTCGSCIAVLGGVDVVAFSGKYCNLGGILRGFLKKNLRISGAGKIVYHYCRSGLPVLCADFAESVVIRKKLQTVS